MNIDNMKDLEIFVHFCSSQIILTLVLVDAVPMGSDRHPQNNFRDAYASAPAAEFREVLAEGDE